ncbi:MAG: NusG domain II-containing protein [Coriobacteriia bacterium]|nr:NusG domain II-containing protein [Coriobacteriia bacterium]
MTRADMTLLALLALVALLAYPAGGALAGVGGAGAVLVGPRGTTEVDLNRPGRYVVEGTVGEVVFEVAGGSLICVDSSCPDSVCVRSGRLAPGAPIICAPNGVYALDSGSPGGTLDAVSR